VSTDEDPDQASHHRLLTLLAFAAVYLIWGSTYLAIRVGVRSLPPLLLSGSRFVVAGGLLYAFLRARARRRPRAPSGGVPPSRACSCSPPATAS